MLMDIIPILFKTIYQTTTTPYLKAQIVLAKPDSRENHSIFPSSGIKI